MAKNEGPKTEAQNTAAGDKSTVVKNSREVTTGTGVVQGNAPGSVDQKASSDIVLEGLGNLSDTENAPVIDDPTSGKGEYVVVLNDTVSGVSRSYPKGAVRRISNFLPGYGVPEKANEVKAAAARLFDLKAIRLATREEEGQNEVALIEESDAIQQERARRRQLEKELEFLKKQQSLDKNFQGAEQDSKAPETPPLKVENWE